MATPQPQFVIQKQPQPQLAQQQQQQQQQSPQQQTLQQQQLALIKEKLKELGTGPYTPEQQKQRDNLINLLGSNQAHSVTDNSNQQQQQPQQSQQQQQANNQGQQQLNASPAASQQNQILDKRALQDLVKEVDPSEQLDEDVEDMLLQIADDFIENIINTSCQLAKHRKSNILEVKDVQFHLERNYNIWVPGFSTDELKPYKKSYATEAHKQRLQLIKKSVSKPGDGKSGKD